MQRVSFVIPTHNRATILSECLHALEHEYHAEKQIPFEVIVVDDGSNDDTIAVVEQLQHDLALPVRLLRQENRGPAAARNHGIDAATGDLIIFLGDDIIVRSGYLACMIAAYEAHPGESRGVLGYTRYRSDSTPTPFGRWLDAESGLQFAYQKAQVDTPLGYDLFYTSNILVPKQLLLSAGGFNIGFRRAAFEDIELGYRLVQQGFKLYYCPYARAMHVHDVSLKATAARVKMTASAAIELRTLNPELFSIVYPRANWRFEHPPISLRMMRWLLAEPMLITLETVDSRLGARMPGNLYRRTLDCVHNREIARLVRTIRRAETYPHPPDPENISKVTLLKGRDVGDGSAEPLVCVVILNWNNIGLTMDTLSSLQRQTYPRLCTIVLDNGSDDQQEALNQIRIAFPEAHTVAVRRNLGFAGGCNVGMREAIQMGADYLLLLNNDVLVDSDAIAELVVALTADPIAGAAGPLIYYAAEPEHVWFGGGKMVMGGRVLAEHNETSKPDPKSPARTTDWLPGTAMLVRREVVQRVGLMDTSYFLYWEDIDWCYAIRRAGYHLLFVPRSQVWHKVNASTGKLPMNIVYYWERNRLRFIERWGSWPARVIAWGKILWRSIAWRIQPLDDPQAQVKLEAYRDYLLRRSGPRR